VKNASGGDSPQTAREAIDAIARRWLAIASIEVPNDQWAEIDHARVDCEDDVRAGVRRAQDAGLVLASRTK
jgi:hypothetical protein